MPRPTRTRDEIDLGKGHVAEIIVGKVDGKLREIGIIETHVSVLNGHPCSGSILWKQPDGDRPGRDVWNLVSREPLTLDPSINCSVCGSHGFIVGGQWIDA